MVSLSKATIRNLSYIKIDGISNERKDRRTKASGEQHGVDGFDVGLRPTS